MNIVITMAGRGKRFFEAGYRKPKYEIRVKGRTLFSWALSSLEEFIQPTNHFVFIARKEDKADKFVESECQLLGIRNASLVELKEMTDGQATTVLFCQEAPIDTNSPLLIYNIDTHVKSKYLSVSMVRGDGWIPCFPGKGEGWSFAKLGSDGRVVEVREKQRISPHATIGLYGFSSFRLYQEAYNSYYTGGVNLEKGERYIAPLYNQLIKDGKNVYIQSIALNAVMPMGTPEEVAAFALDGCEGADHDQ